MSTQGTRRAKVPVRQPTAAPTRKVVASGVAGALVLVVVWVVGLFGLDVPPEVAAAATVVVAGVAGYVRHDVIDRRFGGPEHDEQPATTEPSTEAPAHEPPIQGPPAA